MLWSKLMPRQSQSDKINKLDKDVALIAQEVKTIKDNHLVHLDQKISNINKILIAVTFFIITELLILVRMLMMG
jgi:DNA/RNA-binding domain of Phe-tRNA-synthetase-like protein